VVVVNVQLICVIAAWVDAPLRKHLPKLLNRQRVFVRSHSQQSFVVVCPNH
jgi:hypothetical protein